jgi:aryl-alcohol dehydrogenase (NADP+)
MRYTSLGRTGLQVSRICLGMLTFGDPKWRPWILPEDAARPVVRRALELGVTFFDVADMYSLGVSEEILGRALGDFAARDRVVVATKVYYPMSDDPNDRGLSRKHILASIDASLRRLRTDYVDLYQIHRWDPHTPIEETLRALEDVVRAGKARYLGASSMYAWQFAKALHLADRNGWSRFVSMQNHYNLLYREEEREMMPLCADEGVGVVPWSPLARGFLAGNRKRDAPAPTERARTDAFAHEMYYTDADYRIAEALDGVAAAKGAPNAQVALAWLLHKPGVTAPIVGVSKVSQLEDVAAAVDVTLTAEEIAALEAPYTPRRILGHS